MIRKNRWRRGAKSRGIGTEDSWTTGHQPGRAGPELHRTGDRRLFSWN